MTKEEIIKLNHRYVWQPFTQMQDWLKQEPIIIVEGNGCILKDIDGREYIDGISSLWVNLHGHNKKEINDAIKNQLDKIAHSTMLGLANIPSAILAQKLVEITPKNLTKVFFSDDGSTAMEVGLKMAFQFWRHTEPNAPLRSKFISLTQGYHGDTIGAVSLGGIDLFHNIFKPLLFQTLQIPSPYCYRCPFGKVFGNCKWECIEAAEKIIYENKAEIAAVVIEPLVQCAGGFIVQPKGYLRKIADICRKNNILLIADEVAVGFGRTGTMFACEQEKVEPDIMAVSKGITGGYLPLAATLTTEEIFNAFLGEYGEKKTFFHGHSYTGNQLGCAAAIASLEVFEKENTLANLQSKIRFFVKQLRIFENLKHVGDVRHCGFMGALELVKDKSTKELYHPDEKVEIEICEKVRKRGVLLRPLGNVIYFMPPYCIGEEQLVKMLDVTYQSIKEVTE